MRAATSRDRAEPLGSCVSRAAAGLALHRINVNPMPDEQDLRALSAEVAMSGMSATREAL
jgi:hypothetical protein